jgi:glycosyltransferase involved in cell wall biosynthesis
MMNERPLKILHVTPYFYPAWAYGGIPRIAYDIACEQTRQGHDVSAVTTDVLDEGRRREFKEKPASWPAFEVIDGVKSYYFRNVSNSLAYRMQLFMPLGARRWAKKHVVEFNILHLHGHRHLLNSAFARAARARGVPYILAANGTAPAIERRFLLKRIFDPFFGNHVLRNAAHFVAVSEAEIGQYESLKIPREKISVVHNGVNLAGFAEIPPRGMFRRKHDLGSRKVILYLGKITPRKGIEVLARAYAKLLSSGRLKKDGSALIIAGNDMGYRHVLEREIASLGIGDCVKFVGLVTGEEKLACLADAGVCVYASTQEIFGLVPFEALMCGTPVVVSDDCGCGELIGRARAGRRVKYGDAEGLAQAIRETLEMPEGEKADVISRGRRFVAENLAYEKIARQYVEVYRKAIAAR